MKWHLLSLLIGLYSVSSYAPDGVLPLGASLSKCYRQYVTLGETWPLTRPQIDGLLRGDDPEPVATTKSMGGNALSYLYMATHLTGAQKAELWELFTERIRALTRQPFKTKQDDITDQTIKAYRGPNGILLVIRLEDGQLFKGGTDENFLPEDWDYKKEIGRGRLQPVGSPSRAR